MQTYNRVMLYLWLVLAVATFLGITYGCITEGWKKWVFFYIFPLIALMMYFFKRWMMNRMKKHLEFLEGKNKG